jgi:hypothetical protein
MQCTGETRANRPLRRSLILAISSITTIVVLFRFYGHVPVEYYRYYAPGEAIAPVVTTNNDVPQPGYFKGQPEWYWDIPKYANSWSGYARTPRNKDIVVLTASDGGGHNSAIKNVLGRVLDDREKYCEAHGYTSLWLNTSRYDVGSAHRVRLLLLLPPPPTSCKLTPARPPDMVQDPRRRRGLLPVPQRRMDLAHRHRHHPHDARLRPRCRDPVSRRP